MQSMPEQRFRTTICKSGLNPYVDVPERVARSFARFARAGRIRVEGRLNQTPIRATLIPSSQGRHRLFVNGGMRAAARVTVGETVVFSLRAKRPDAVLLPADLAAALARVKGTRTAFEKLTPSHRRELIRYIDDARTSEARRERIQKAIAHASGKQVRASGRGMRGRALWSCARCGHRFVNPNQMHSCHRHRLSEVFAGKPAHIRALFDRFRRMVESCGPVTRVVYRDRVGFMVRVRFAGAVPAVRWLDVGFWLPQRLNHPCFQRVETIYPNAHVHIVRVTEPRQLDSRLRGWIKQAYAVGCQEHLPR